MRRLSFLLLTAAAAGFHTPIYVATPRSQRHTQMSALSPKAAATVAAGLAALGSASPALAARSGGRVGGRVGGGGGMRGGGGGAYRGGGVTNVYMAPPMFSPFGFGFSPFGFSPFGFGFGFGIPGPLLLLALGGLAATSFRSSRGIEAADNAGAALCLQVACYCDNRGDSLYSRLGSIARTADASTYFGLQSLVSDTCLAMLRSSKDWLAGRTKSETAGILTNDVETAYNRLVVQERAKWESEQGSLTRNAPGQPTYMVATLVVLLRSGSALPQISGATDLREAIQILAAEVSVQDNLLGAELRARAATPVESRPMSNRVESRTARAGTPRSRRGHAAALWPACAPHTCADARASRRFSCARVRSVDARGCE